MGFFGLFEEVEFFEVFLGDGVEWVLVEDLLIGRTGVVELSGGCVGAAQAVEGGCILGISSYDLLV